MTRVPEERSSTWVSPSILFGRGASPGEGRGILVLYESIRADQYSHSAPIVILASVLDQQVIADLPSNVSAVIASNGSIGCHGAGVLRELGLPCVVDIPPDAALTEGCEVLVDGSRGRVSVLYAHGPKDISDGFFGNASASVALEESACYRPNRRYQQLRFEMLQPGWEYSPLFLYGLPKCQLVLADGVIHIHHGPNLRQLRHFVLDNPSCFHRAALRRQSEISGIVITLKRLDLTSTITGPLILETQHFLIEE